MQDVPNIIYKYRNFEGLNVKNNWGVKTLFNYQLYAASKDKFNDPFDNALPFIYLEDTFILENFIKKYIRHSKNIDDLKYKSRIELIYAATERYNYIVSDREKHWEENKERINKLDNDFYGILSFSKCSENILMWSHYAEYHKGFCLGFNTDLFLKQIENIAKSNGCKFGPVIYDNKYPIIDFIEEYNVKTTFERCFTKNECWEYEEEYRLVLNKMPNQIIKYPKEIIEEIYLGCKMKDDHMKEIITFLKEQNLKIRLYKMEMGYKKFELIPKLIDYT